MNITVKRLRSAVALGGNGNGRRAAAVVPLGVEAGGARGRTLSEALRRGLNIALALVGLLLSLPLMLLVAAAIKLSSPGPVLYLQARVGLDRRAGAGLSGNGRRRIDYGGRLFTIYKFRTMRVSPPGAAQTWAVPDDPRITPLGRLLRSYRLDELPQLFNVLKGDMNLVGPRPEQPTIFAELRTRIERYPDRQKVLPGITGWAQVNLPYDSSVENVRNKLRYDLEYIERRGIREDVKIVLRTFPVVFLQRGAW